jgi:UDP-glucose 4-epimerase
MAIILITGATGFIGSHLTEFFIRNNYDIIAHGSSKESINRLKDKLKINKLYSKDLQFWQQDFLDYSRDIPDLTGIDFIIHCAAATKIREGTFENYDKFFGLNVIMAKLLAERALEDNVKHFIYLSSGQVFGIPPSFPFTEKTPKNPINIYGFTKLIGEIVISSFGALGLNYTITRPFSVYGKGQNNIISIIKDRILNDEILTIYGDGQQSRAFTHVNDICEAIGIILNNPKCFGEDYNLSGSREYSVNKLVQLIANKMKKLPHIVRKESSVAELKRNIADTAKIIKLGFNFKSILEQYIHDELI